MGAVEVESEIARDDLREVVDLLSSYEMGYPDITGNPVWRDMVHDINSRWAICGDGSAADSTEKCGTCRFWQQSPLQSPNRAREPIVLGRCRRHAPSQTSDDDNFAASFPGVVQDQWCGEFEASESLRMEQRRVSRINVEASRLLGIACAAVKAEASGFDMGEKGHLGRVSAKLGAEQPDLEVAIRARAITLAGDDAAVLALLAWAALDATQADAS